MENDTPIVFEIKNVHSIELEDLSKSLLSFGDEYRRWNSTHYQGAMAGEIKLHVKEIRSGSIIADLVAIAPSALPFIEHAVTVVDFCKYLNSAYSWLLGKSSDKPQGLEIANLENLSNIIEPVAKDNGSQINISTVNIEGPIYISISSQESNAIQNTITRFTGDLKKPVSTIHEKVLLYWYQARNDIKAKTGDKAIVESISKKPVKAICMNESIKAKMLRDSENPFTHSYIVDLTVETIQGRPTLYRILDVHEILELQGQESE